MAKAEIKTQTIETTVMVQVPQVKTEVQQTGVKLDLTMAEAETLRTLIYATVVGSLTKSPRKYLNRIEEALQDAGVLSDSSHYRFSGKVACVDYPSEKKASKITGKTADLVIVDDLSDLEVPPVAPKKGDEPKVGDRIEITASPYDEHARFYVVGNIGTIKAVLGGGQVDAEFGTGKWTVGHRPGSCFKVLPPEAPEAPPREFQVGDKVRVVRKVEKEKGWDNSWVDSMDSIIGRLRTIKDIRSGGVYFEEVGMGFPPSALELIPKETLGSLLEKKLKAPKVGDKVRILPSGDHYLTIWPGYTGTVVEDKRPVDPTAALRFVVVPDVVPVGGLQKYAYNFEDIEVLSS